MCYRKNRLYLIPLLFFLVMLSGSMSFSYAKENTIDLGDTGFTAQVQVRETGKDYLTQNIPVNIPQNIILKPPNIFYKSSLPKHGRPSVTRHISFRKNPSLPIGTKIFVFSCYDEESLKVASTVSFDYGLCIEYKSADDIRDFKKDLNLKQPIAMSNDETVKAFGVSAYPALITVRDNEFEIQEGF